jgi:photosystem II stability/assembly factor-like uncharacterized protein
VGVVVVAAVIIVVFFVPLPHVSLFNRLGRQASTSSTALAWSARDLGPAEFDTVSCPTPSSCVALGPEGWVARTSDAGLRWTVARVASLEGATFERVVCPSATRCLALGKTDQAPLAPSALAPSAVAVSTDGGLRWERASAGGSAVAFLGGLACPTTKICYASATALPMGDRGVLLKSTNGGLTWERLSWPVPTLYSDVAISCPSVRRCWAIGGPEGVVTTNNGGRSWSSQKGAFGAGGYPDIAELYCPNTRLCIGVGTEPHPGYPAIVMTDNGGASWHFVSYGSPPTGFLAFSSGGLASVSCSTAHYCEAVGTADNVGPILMTSADGGKTWAQNTAPSLALGGGLSDVACDAESGCVVAGSTRNGAPLLATSSPSRPWDVRLQGIGSNWASISCVGSEDCVAVGGSSTNGAGPDGAEILTSTNGGLSWVLQTTPPGVVGLSGIDCTSASRCYATAYVASSPKLALNGEPWTGAVLESDDGGSTWRRESLPEVLVLNAITCPRKSTCFAVGATGTYGHDKIIKTVDGGARWVDQPVPTPVGAEGLYGVSCPSVDTCWAIGNYGALVTTNGGRRWWDQPVAAQLQAIACPSELRCVAVGPGYGFGPTNALALYLTDDGGRVWSGPKVPGRNLALEAISCPESSQCVAVGSDSKGAVVLASFDGGRQWSAQPVANLVPSFAFNTVNCTTSRHCIALGGGSVAALALGP